MQPATAARQRGAAPRTRSLTGVPPVHCARHVSPLVAFVDGTARAARALGGGGGAAATRFSVATEATAFVAAPCAARAGGFGELGVADGGFARAAAACACRSDVPRPRRNGGKRGDGGATAAMRPVATCARARDASDARAPRGASHSACACATKARAAGDMSHAVRQASVDYLEHAICAAVSGEA